MCEIYDAYNGPSYPRRKFNFEKGETLFIPEGDEDILSFSWVNGDLEILCRHPNSENPEWEKLDATPDQTIRFEPGNTEFKFISTPKPSLWKRLFG